MLGPYGDMGWSPKIDRHEWRLAEVKRLYIDGHIDFYDFEDMLDKVLRDQEIQLKLPRPDLDPTHMANDDIVEFW